jgi:hypothetical protein
VSDNGLIAGLGQGVGGLASLGNGIAQSGAYAAQGRINEQMAQLQAADARRRGDIAAGQQYQRGQQIVSAQRAQMGASGADVNSGTNAIIQAGTGAISELDRLTISHNAALEAIGYNFQGRMAGIAGQNNASMALNAGIMGLGKGLIQGANSINQYRITVPRDQPNALPMSPGSGDTFIDLQARQFKSGEFD